MTSIFRQNADPGEWLAILLPIAQLLSSTKNQNPTQSYSSPCRLSQNAYLKKFCTTLYLQKIYLPLHIKLILQKDPIELHIQNQDCNISDRFKF